MPWPVIYFPKVTKFILKLPEPLRMRIISSIDLIEIYGLGLRAPLSKKITNKVYELRIQGENSMRILYCFQKGKFYLLHIFRKKTQRMPKKEIKIALDRMKLLI